MELAAPAGAPPAKPLRYLINGVLIAGTLLATNMASASQVRLGAEVFRPGADGKTIAVELIRTPGNNGELRAARVDWQLGDDVAADFAGATGTVVFARGQRSATLPLELTPAARDQMRRFGQIRLTRGRGSDLATPAVADLEVGGVRIDEEVLLGAGRNPALAFLTGGGTLVAWDDGPNLRTGQFDDQGHLVRPGRRPVLQRESTCCPLQPGVFATGDGGYFLTWHDQDADRRGIFARRFDARDEPIGPVFPINAEQRLEQLGAALHLADDGHFLATYGSTDLVVAIPFVMPTSMARAFSADGTPLGPDVALWGNRVAAVEPLANGGWALLVENVIRRVGVFYAFQVLAADGTPQQAIEIPASQHYTELATQADGRVAALGCESTAIHSRTVLRYLSPNGDLDPEVTPYGDGDGCDPTISLHPGRLGRVGLFVDPTSPGPDPPLSLRRVDAAGESFEMLRLLPRCLNAGLCDYENNTRVGIYDPLREAVAVVWDSVDGLRLRHFPWPLRGIISADTPGPRVAPGERETLALRLYGDREAAVVHFATANDSATAGEDYAAAAGNLVLTRNAAATTLEVPIFTPANQPGEESFRISLTPEDPLIAVTSPKRAPVFIIRDTVCNRLIPALCFAGRTIEVRSADFIVPLQLDDTSGLLRRDANSEPEVAVKVIGTRRDAKVYWASVADQPTSLHVADDISGAWGSVGEASEEICGSGIDEDPYNAPLPLAGTPATSDQGPATGLCVNDSTELCLLDGRFAVSGKSINPYDGNSGPIRWQQVGTKTGIGKFGSQLLELLVRVESRPDGVLFAAAPLTDFALDLTVRDAISGATRNIQRAAGESCRIYLPDVF